jgi:hypothetical protein
MKAWSDVAKQDKRDASYVQPLQCAGIGEKWPNQPRKLPSLRQPDFAAQEEQRTSVPGEKYCSRKCTGLAIRKPPPLPDKKCLSCGKPLVPYEMFQKTARESPGSRQKKCCSRKCTDVGRTKSNPAKRQRMQERLARMDKTKLIWGGTERRAQTRSSSAPAEALL